MWKAVFCLYMVSPNLPLPTYEEIVICTEDTTVEEVKNILYIPAIDVHKLTMYNYTDHTSMA